MSSSVEWSNGAITAARATMNVSNRPTNQDSQIHTPNPPHPTDHHHTITERRGRLLHVHRARGRATLPVPGLHALGAVVHQLLRPPRRGKEVPGGGVPKGRWVRKGGRRICGWLVGGVGGCDDWLVGGGEAARPACRRVVWVWRCGLWVGRVVASGPVDTPQSSPTHPISYPPPTIHHPMEFRGPRDPVRRKTKKKNTSPTTK